MRITRIHLKNLNSLAGEWSIDLDRSEYAGEGIFAITGPTGAGKSTILDAICLALYGQTPRLGRLSAGSNDIMSRRAGECSAEVEFELASGRYRCTWYQHRARRRTGGALQPYTHQIADITRDPEHGEILESASSRTAARVTELTGLDFDRFTRSMLLAQGHFAAFLNASPSERAPILEQITGTALYGLVSRRAHERLNREKARRDALMAELAGLRPLAPEEEAALRAELRAAAERDDALAREESALRSALHWLEQDEELHAAQSDVRRKEEEHAAREQDFAPMRERLARARRALELAADHAALTALRERKNAADAALREQKAELARLDDARNDASARLESALADENAARKERERALPLLRAIRAMDARLAEKAENLTRLAKEAESARIRHDMRVRERDECLAAGIRLEEEKRKLDRALTDGSADDALGEALPLLRERLAALEARRKEARTAEEELETAQNTRRNTEREAAFRKRESGRLAELEDSVRRAAERAEEELAALLNGKPPEQPREELAALRIRSQALAALRGSAVRRAAALRNRDEKNRTRIQISADIAAAEKELGILREREKLLVGNEALCQEQIRIAASVSGLAEHRSALRDGVPCPLCGAVHHPYASGGIPHEDEARASLRNTRTELEQTRAELLDREKACSAARRDLDNLSAQAEDCLKLAEAEDIFLTEHAADAGLSAGLLRSEEGGAVLERARAGLDAALERAECLNRALNAAEVRVTALRREAREAGDALNAARLEAERRESAAALARAALERTERTALERHAARDDAERAWQEALTPLHPLSGLSDADALRALEARRERRERLRSEARDLERRRERQLAARDALEEQLRADERALRETASALAAAQAERNAAEASRRETLRELDAGASGADEAEMRGENTLRAAEQAARRALSLREGAERALEASLSRLRELEQGGRELCSDLAEREDCFAELLRRKGFAGENGERGEDGGQPERLFMASLLNEEEREELRRKEQELDDEGKRLAALREELKARRAALDEAVPELPAPPPPPENGCPRLPARNGSAKLSLSARLEAVLAERARIQRDMGMKEQQLEADARLNRELGEKREILQRQEAEYRRWQDLHDLMGSHDGAKFRTFAQGLTFDAVIALANRQLVRMTDRYTLLRAPSADGEGAGLELAVRDHWQAGEVRTTRNLSGGESFLVSLALALGLSRLASRKIRVDSLFLDEGFGTLDAEALDVALDTLGSLRRDGKIIGVISHVAALRDRIGTRIELARGTGGVSTLHGPGCERIGA